MRKMVLLVCGCMLFVACTSKQIVVEKKKQELHIAFTDFVQIQALGFDNQSSLERNKTDIVDLFEILHPHISVRVSTVYDTELGSQALMNYMNSIDPPDVVFFQKSDLSALLENNMLEPLNSLIDNKEVSLAPPVVETLTTYAKDGLLYALSPFYLGSVLYLNKALFEQMNVPVPEEDSRWTWNDLNLFAEDIKGPNQFGAVSRYGWAELAAQRGIAIQKNGKMAVQTTAWEEVFSLAAQLAKESKKMEALPLSIERQISEEGGEEKSNGEWFLTGKLGMYIGRTSFMEKIKMYNEYVERNKTGEKIDVAIRAVPTFAQQPNTGLEMQFQGLMGMSTKTQNTEAAQEFIRFLHSEQWAIRKRAAFPQFRTTFQGQGDPESNEEFYPVLPVGKEEEFHYDLTEIGNEQFQEVIAQKKTVRQALSQWQEIGSKVLEAETNKKGKSDAGL
jgi:multiple sugar transport system substrate-binding protein